jgi:hypothetical protein
MTILVLLALSLCGCSTTRPEPTYLTTPCPELYVPPILLEAPEPVRPLYPGYWPDNREDK